MAYGAGPTVLAGLLMALAASPAAATHPELACAHFGLTPPLALPREALVVHSVSLRADDVLLNGECVSRRARIRRRPDGRVRFVALFAECGLARGIKMRGGTDAACSAMRGRLVGRRPPFRARFAAVPVFEHDCGPDGACAPGFFCELPPGICAANVFAGACVPVPDACPDVVDPVCGCDGTTYGNDCERQAAGVSKSHDGICETDGCRDNAACGEGGYCAKDVGECDGRGICLPRPGGCITVYQPVCGCDGETYPSACDAAVVGVSVAATGPCRDRCGTIAGLPCPDGFVCDLEAGMCGVVDLGGVCVPEPDACPEIYAPVCGCDGATYANDCERVAAGAQKDHDGPCECPPILCPPDTLPVDTNGDGCVDDCISARCETSADCPEDRWCSGIVGDCASPGWCELRPLGCPDVWQPVCGCDGATYSNDCDAAAAGVRVAHDGTCVCEPPICPDGTRPHDGDGDGCDDECVPWDACFADEDCVRVSPDLFCRWEDGVCGPPGRCQEVPRECPAVVDPVCGCDEVTYVNECEGALFGIRHRGPCAPTCGTIAGIACPEGYVCDLEPGSCDVSDAGGRCVEKPGVCPELYVPVCGCDGTTYGNDCERIAAGVTKAHDGECTCRTCPDGFFPIDTGDDGCPDVCIGPPCETTCGDGHCTIVCTAVEPA